MCSVVVVADRIVGLSSGNKVDRIDEIAPCIPKGSIEERKLVSCQKQYSVLDAGSSSWNNLVENYLP